ncbi:hypothetical protein K7432_002097 [Basidiobolus ranarum]|uniref:NADH dehydrogenase [ubiquinone] 1 beta subcomplex subunit 8, mitochondrial n=1 Tax=Basidiobolus ranarum TaxID=34480 RepID=A0ABR2W8E7_9FUNG
MSLRQLQRCIRPNSSLLKNAQRAQAHTVNPCEARLLHSYSKPQYVDPDPQIGDYPNLPWENKQTRYPRDYWDQTERRNFGETIPEQDEVLSVWITDPNPINPWRALAELIAVGSVIVGGTLALATYALPDREVAIPRDYPYDGLRVEMGGDPNDSEDLSRSARKFETN